MCARLHRKRSRRMRQNWGVGAVTTDHMFIMDYTEGKGWHDPRIIPYGPIELDPFAKCLHYGREVVLKG